MSSRRIHGKVLKIISSKLMLLNLLERLNHCPGFKKNVVAASNGESDKPTANFCQWKKIPCFRGSLENVAS